MNVESCRGKVSRALGDYSSNTKLGQCLLKLLYFLQKKRTKQNYEKNGIVV